MLAHPWDVRAIAESVKKCDRHDARLPQAHIASDKVRRDRQRVLHRANPSRMGTRAKSHVTAILDGNGVIPPWKNVFTQRGTRWIKGLGQHEAEQEALEDWLAVLEALERLERGAEERVESSAEGTAGMELLPTIPRLGTMSATASPGAIDAVEGFPQGKRLSAYFGLVQIVRSSGETVRRGSISKRGDPWLRWLLVQAA